MANTQTVGVWSPTAAFDAAIMTNDVTKSPWYNGNGQGNQAYQDGQQGNNYNRTAANTLFDAKVDSANAQAQADAQAVYAQGDRAEADAYDNAASIADQNARLARVSGSVQQFQAGREAFKAMSGQRADIAAAGFGTHGTAAYMMADSAQQASLNSQMIGTQTEITVGGYQQQAEAQRAQATTARYAADAADVLGANAQNVGQMIQTNALNNAMDLYNQGNQRQQTSPRGSNFGTGIGVQTVQNKNGNQNQGTQRQSTYRNYADNFDYNQAGEAVPYFDRAQTTHSEQTVTTNGNGNGEGNWQSDRFGETPISGNTDETQL